MNLIDESIYGSAIKGGKLDLYTLFKSLYEANYLQYHDPCFSRQQQGCCIMLNGCLAECFTNGEEVSFEDKLALSEEITPLFEDCEFEEGESPLDGNKKYFQATANKLRDMGYNCPYFNKKKQEVDETPSWTEEDQKLQEDMGYGGEYF